MHARITSIQEKSAYRNFEMTVVIAAQEQIMDPDALAQLAEQTHVDALTCTPSYLSNMIEVPTFAQVMKQIHAVDVGKLADAVRAAIAAHPYLFMTVRRDENGLLKRRPFAFNRRLAAIATAAASGISTN